MTNVEGVYDDQKKLISEIKPFDLENLIKWKVVQGGDPKIENCGCCSKWGERCSNSRWKKTAFNFTRNFFR